MTSNRYFDSDDGNPGQGFFLGRKVGWGHNDESSSMYLGNLGFQQSVVASTFRSGTFRTYINGVYQSSLGGAKTQLNDSNRIRFLSHRNLNENEGSGLSGRMSFAVDFSKELSAAEIAKFYEIYRKHLGQGLGLPQTD